MRIYLLSHSRSLVPGVLLAPQPEPRDTVGPACSSHVGQACLKGRVLVWGWGCLHPGYTRESLHAPLKNAHSWALLQTSESHSLGIATRHGEFLRTTCLTLKAEDFCSSSMHPNCLGIFLNTDSQRAGLGQGFGEKGWARKGLQF